jgi:hypothetical protein
VLQLVEGVGGARVAHPPNPGQHEERLQDVVVPVRRITRLEPGRVDDLSGTQAAKQPVLEEQLGGAIRGGSGS